MCKERCETLTCLKVKVRSVNHLVHLANCLCLVIYFVFLYSRERNKNKERRVREPFLAATVIEDQMDRNNLEISRRICVISYHSECYGCLINNRIKQSSLENCWTMDRIL